MSLQRRFSLQFGLTAGAGVAAALAAALTVFGMRVDDMSAGLRGNIEGAVERQLRRDGEAVLDRVADEMKEALLDYDAETLGRLARASAGGTFATAIKVYDTHGRALADSAGGATGVANAAPGPLRAITRASGVQRWSEGDQLVAGKAVCIRETCIGAISVAVDGSAVARERAALDSDMDAARSDFFRQALIMGLIALAVISLFAAGVGFLLGKRLTQSLSAAIRGLEQLASGATDVKIDSRDDQLQELSQAVEALAEKLGAARADSDPIIDGLADGLFVATPQGAFTIANPALHTLLGVKPPALLGADAFAAFGVPPAPDAQAFAAAVGAVSRVTLPDGARQPVMVSARVAGSPPDEKVIGVVRDMTELLRAEEELRAATLRAEAADRAKAQFLSVMSHELRTPLNGVLGGAAVLAGTELNPSQQNFVGIVQKSGRALLQMISDVLDLSKAEAGETVVERAPVNLDTVAHEIAASVADAAAAKGLELQVRVQPGAPVVLSDHDKLFQIGQNLADNAVKFTERGRVGIAITHQQRDGEAEITLTVEDTGIGIAPGQQETIFDNFTQADSSARRSQGGAGLGLAITKKLTETMGGAVSVDSKPGEGATFKVSLSAEIDAAATADQPRLPAVRALVIAPGAHERETLAEQLAHAGADATVAASAEEAAALMQAARDSGAPFAMVTHPADLPGLTESGLEAILRPENPAFAVASVVCGPEQPDALALPPYVQPVERTPNAATLLRAAQTALAAAARHAPAPEAAPVAAPKAAAQAPEAAPAAKLGPDDAHIVLLAEDNEVNRIVLSAYLRKAGFTCHTAPNGFEAVKLYKETHPKLVLMAATMPVMNGVDAARAIRRYEEDANLTAAPIIGLIPGDREGDREICAAAGMNDHLVKPVKMDQLGAKLDRWTVLFGHGENRAAAS